jgi:hypothetical protein
VSRKRIVGGVGIAAAAIPLIILLTFFAYVIRARLAAGYWPSYSHPESWSMGFSIHYAILRPWFHILPFWLLPFPTVLYNSAVWIVFRKFPKWSFIALGLSTIIVYAWLWTDPGEFLDWFLD